MIGGTKDNYGGGILIKDTKNLNFFQNVTFKNLNGNIDFIPEGYLIFGAINFFNSKVNFDNFNVRNITSEDAINFVNSEIHLRNGLFDNIESDAIDVDNGSGKIEKIKILNVSNDGLDFSESNLNVSEVIFDNIGDKSISVGENSVVSIEGINISNSYLGIVSKDGSKVTGQNIKNFNVTIPYASYVKKKEYTQPVLNIVNGNEENFERLYLKDNLANIMINKKRKNKITGDVIGLIYDPSKKIQ